MQPLVFEKFWQQEAFITRRSAGTGLGLTLCKRLVELMGGQIGFHSRPKLGSTFYFTLPCKSSPATHTP
jgi:signal transduction histidine kinase